MKNSNYSRLRLDGVRKSEGSWYSALTTDKLSTVYIHTSTIQYTLVEMLQSYNIMKLLPVSESSSVISCKLFIERLRLLFSKPHLRLGLQGKIEASMAQQDTRGELANLSG